MITAVCFSEAVKWDNLVKSFSNYDVYYLLSYTMAFNIHGDGDPILFYYEDENIKAMNVVMKRDISNDARFTEIIPSKTYFDVTTPYGYGGFLIEGKITDDALMNLDKKYKLFCNNEGIISEFVRFHPVLKNSNMLRSIYDISDLGKSITIQLESQDQIWNDFSSKNRNVIRKALKSQVEIYWGRSKELFTEFMHLYNSTMDRDNAKDYYYFKEDFYLSLLNDLKFNSLMFYAVYNGGIIAMSIIIFANDRMHYHLSASKKEYQSLAPTNLLLYEASCWGMENGFKSLHLGGGLGSKEDNLYKFKKAFNRVSDRTFSIGRKIFNREKYDQLLKIRDLQTSLEKEPDFFPLYRS